MKIKFTILFFAFSICSFAQTIRRVNNNGITGTNIYSTIQAAHDAAVNGDIIYVEGTKTSYAGFTCIKQLTFIGAGYFLVENAPIQADQIESYLIGAAVFNTGSSGSQMYGFHIEVSFSFPAVNLNSSNITIGRNRLAGNISIGSNVSNLLITQNYISGTVSSMGSTTISNLTISNNILKSTVELSTTTSGVCLNNIMTFLLGGGLTSFYNFTVSNNICTATGPISLNNNTFSNNIGASTQFPAGSGNQQNVSMTNFFVVDPASGDLDSRWKLKAGSPAIGAGVGGVDCGAFGGASPYVISGIPPYPTITSLITSGVGNTTTPINVVISTKSN